MLVVSALFYTLGATFLANIFGLFSTPGSLQTLWRAFVSVSSRRTPSPLSVGGLDHSPKHTLSLDASSEAHVVAVTRRYVSSSSIIRLPSSVPISSATPSHLLSGLQGNAHVWIKTPALDLRAMLVLLGFVLLYVMLVRCVLGDEPTQASGECPTTRRFLVDVWSTEPQESITDRIYLQCVTSLGIKPSSSIDVHFGVPRYLAGPDARADDSIISGPLFFTSQVAPSPPRSPTVHQQLQVDPPADDDGWRVYTRRKKARFTRLDQATNRALENSRNSKDSRGHHRGLQETAGRPRIAFAALLDLSAALRQLSTGASNFWRRFWAWTQISGEGSTRPHVNAA